MIKPHTAQDSAPTGEDETQRVYARVLDALTRVGALVLLVSFAAYLSGVLPARIAPQQLPSLWHHPVQRYLEITGAPTGWQWLSQLPEPDMLGLGGIALLAGCSGVCLLALVALYRARRDYIYMGLCLAQCAVLVVAASGWFGAGP